MRRCKNMRVSVSLPTEAHRQKICARETPPIKKDMLHDPNPTQPNPIIREATCIKMGMKSITLTLTQAFPHVNLLVYGAHLKNIYDVQLLTLMGSWSPRADPAPPEWERGVKRKHFFLRAVHPIKATKSSHVN